MTIQVPPVGFVSAGTLEEAARLVSDPAERAVLIAGGTDLVPKLKRRQTAPITLVSLADIEAMHGIAITDDGSCVIGALTTLAEIADSSDVPPVLATAASTVASPQIRNSATIGGNLCVDTRCNYIDMPLTWRQARGHCLKDGGDTCWVAPASNRCWAISSTDLAPVAIALNATVRLVSSRGERVVPAEVLYRSDGIDYLTKTPDEILVDITIPAHTTRNSFQKLRRRGSIDFALLSVACAVDLDTEGTCTSARIVVGGIASAPVSATDAETFLAGKQLTPEVIEEASEIASKPVRAQDNTDTGQRYRKWMISVHVAKALNEAAAERA
ncbi:MAG: 4-hydroxybenzoyl-CoA reductase [Armatimonadetes bacterium]|nr:MAG: 4-hydroxybenzoyl-CoA reductase [Armatimonadota bacterium]